MSQSRELLLNSKQVFISCIVPVHNEAANLVDFVTSLQNELTKHAVTYEIILIDDGSNDNSFTKGLLLASGKIRLIKLSRNFGKEAALTAGLDHCSGDIVILIDADFQHPINLIPEFLKQWKLGYDMVYGICSNRDHESWLKRFITKKYYHFLKSISKINMVPNAGDFRLLDRKVVNALNSCNERNRYMKGLYAWVGFNNIGIPFTVAPRAHGKSSWNFARLAELAITGITSFSNVPLRIWSFIGFFIACCAFFAASWIFIKTLVLGVELPGYASIMVTIFFFCGVQLCSIGVLGEYIAKIFNEVKQRPKYIIDQKINFSSGPSVSMYNIPNKSLTEPQV
jgi:glycosyltransferase involved in cell wall biosynthesis